ncbi:MAG: dihydrofolate reductase family protein [Ktedonobacterales bacterium]
MGKVLVGLTMSLDGFINDRNGSVERLYPDLGALRNTELLQDSIQRTGAVVMGRRAYAMGEPDAYAGAYEYQVPIFVLTHAAPATLPAENERLRFTFVTDGIESAIWQARAAAGDKDITVIGGASTAQQCIQARLLDELHIGIVPVFLGGGLRPFDGIEMEHVELEQLQVIESPSRTDLKFRVVK